MTVRGAARRVTGVVVVGSVIAALAGAVLRDAGVEGAAAVEAIAETAWLPDGGMLLADGLTARAVTAVGTDTEVKIGADTVQAGCQ